MVWGPPPHPDGYGVGAPMLAANALTTVRCHPDGDELLYLVSGRVHVILETDDDQRVVEVTGGPALVIPRGVWHQVLL